MISVYSLHTIVHGFSILFAYYSTWFQHTPCILWHMISVYSLHTSSPLSFLPLSSPSPLSPSPLSPLLPLPSLSSPSLLCTCQYSVPDEPTNFNITLVNSTALNASWGEPVDPNGIIEGYQLFLELAPADASYLGNDSRVFNLSATDFTQVVDNLHPFATYRFDVRAMTSVGPGNRTSQSATTAEDGKLCGRHWEG